MTKCEASSLYDCENEGAYVVETPACHPTAQPMKVCHEHVTSYIHIGNDCTGNHVRIADHKIDKNSLGAKYATSDEFEQSDDNPWASSTS